MKTGAQAIGTERDTILGMLKKLADSAPAQAGGDRAALAWAGIKLAAIVMLAAGVGIGLGDGNEFDSAGCSVAKLVDATFPRACSAHAREHPGGKVPASGATASGSSGVPPVCRPECEARAEVCLHRMPGGQCRMSKVMCVLFVGAVGVSDMLARIHREIADARTDFVNLQIENNELRALQQEGFFKFVLRVGAQDFQAFAAVMALGNRKAAADFLEVPHRTFYDRIEEWSARGRDHQLMVRYMDWRKRSSRKIKLRLDDSVQSGEPNDLSENPETVGEVLENIATAAQQDYPSILREVLEALAEQNPKNWDKVRAEVVAIIKEEV